MIAHSTKLDGLNPFHRKGFEAIFPGRRDQPMDQRADLSGRRN